VTHHDPSFLPSDPDRLVGEVFRRMSSLRQVVGDGLAFERSVRAVLAALGRAALDEAELRAASLAERIAPPPPGMRVSSTARRVEFDGFDHGDAE
jgi:hypothetical protein